MNDFEKAILLIRNPLNAIMSTFNDLRIDKRKNTYASLYEFEKFNYAYEVFPRLYRIWQNIYDSVLQDYEHPLLVVEYEKLKRDFIFEMERILLFLGFDMTPEVRSCLLKDSIGNYKRKSRPQKEMDQIYRNFTSVKLNHVHYTYKKYLKKFEMKLNDLQIRQNLQRRHNKYDL